MPNSYLVSSLKRGCFGCPCTKIIQIYRLKKPGRKCPTRVLLGTLLGREVSLVEGRQGMNNKPSHMAGENEGQSTMQIVLVTPRSFQIRHCEERSNLYTCKSKPVVELVGTNRTGKFITCRVEIASFLAMTRS